MRKFAAKHIFSCVMLIFFNIFFLIWAITQDYEEVYKYNILVDVLYLIICELLIARYAFNRGFDIFDPIYFVSIIYLMMFFITPIYDIIIGNYYWFGYSLFKYGVETSTIVFVGYLSMYTFYCVNFRKTSCVLSNDLYNLSHLKKNDFISCKSNMVILPVIYTMYVIAFAANVYYLVNSGYGNLTYILTLGLGGDGNEEVIASNIGFISMFSYSLPTIVLLIWEYGNSRIIKILLFIPMFLLQVARGYRFFIVQIVVTFVAYHYLKTKKRPKIKNMLIFLLFMMAFIIIMTMFRNTIRGGEGIDLSGISGETLSDAFDAAFWDNLRIYQNVYGMVGVIPSQYNYVGLRQILVGTLVMTIPRSIWPGKISSYGGESLRVLIGENIAAGQAYPTIGEYYYAFGTIGVIVFMAIFGLWLKKLRNNYMNSQSSLDGIYFSVMLGCCLQLIIRGYFPSNFWYLLFAVLPIWIIKLVRRE